MSTTFLDRLEPADHAVLKLAIQYAATGDCAEGGRPPTADCDCICCHAERLRQKLWPPFVPAMSVTDAIAVIERDMIPDERRNWDALDRPRGHHYVALWALIAAAKRAAGEEAGGARAVVDRLLRRDGVVAASLTITMHDGTKEIAGLPLQGGD